MGCWSDINGDNGNISKHELMKHELEQNVTLEASKCDQCRKRDANMKDNEIGENQLSVTSVVREILIVSTLVNRKEQNIKRKRAEGQVVTSVEKETHIKPAWEDMRNKNKVSVTSVVREMVIVSTLVNRKELNIKRKTAEGQVVTSVEKEIHIKPAWEDMRDKKNKVSVTSVVREMVIVHKLT